MLKFLMPSATIVLIAGLLVTSDSARAQQPPSARQDQSLTTRWSNEVTAENVHRQYPRPQMVRQQWQNLNGLWQYAIRPKDDPQPSEFDGQILVPFPVEASLSGVKKRVNPDQLLWYRVSFKASPPANGQRLLLHFGAVDWHAIVLVNGQQVGEHRGGYDPFTLDVTDALKDQEEQELVVRAWDPSDRGSQARGKQVLDPEGIWYTPVTGIWQTVWLEQVPAASIASLRAVPDVDNQQLHVTVEGRGASDSHVITVIARDGDQEIGRARGKLSEQLALKIPGAKLWSPASPHLYDLEVLLEREGQPVDRVSSYFGMRKVGLGKDEHGHLRLLLNGEPLFQFGPLDQGWWPDGLYTAPTDEALRYDIELTQKLGFNMLRKHVKVEPARFYYHCDKMGMLVWQDMPSAFHSGSLRIGPADPHDATRDAQSAEQFEAELKAMIDALYNHPSIVMWVPFNEGWGQYDTQRITAWVQKYDPSRLCNATSGWTDRGVGHVHDVHMYPGPGMESGGTHRAAVLGEFGGLGWPVPEHLWWNKRNWGYRTYGSREELNSHYRELIESLEGMLGLGLAAAVYTQTTDVEGEVNGLMTYDREVVKFDPAELTQLHQRLYRWPAGVTVLLEDSELEPQQWRYTTTEPDQGWQEGNTSDHGWQQGAAPFATAPNAFFSQGVAWAEDQPSIWLRTTFDVRQVPDDLRLTLYHEVDHATVYLNGQAIAELTGGTHRHYGHKDVSEHAALLRPGKNTIAIHATKRQGFRAIDLGLYSVKKK